MTLLLISLRSDHGGGPKHLLDLATQLKIDHPSRRIAIAAPDEAPYGPAFKELAGPLFFELPHRKFTLEAFWRLARWARHQGVSTVHSHGRGAGVYSRLLKFLDSRLRVVHTFHGFHRGAGLTGSLKVAVDRLLAPWADAYIAVAPDEKILLESNGCTKEIPCHVILNGVATPSALSPRSHFRGVLGLLARHDHQKGLDLLMRHLLAWNSLSPARPWVFHIAGFAPASFEVPGPLRDRVVLRGPLSDPRAFLRELDLYVSSARWEGLPLSVLEAAAEGVPTLLSDVPGHAYFKDKKVTATFRLEDSNSFCHELNQLFQSETQRLELAQKAFQLVREHHSVERMARETELLYRA